MSCQFTPQSLSSTSDHYLNQCGLSRLDGDKDGVPCEVLYD
ncbi:MAG: excalibur calcium-binding domain-containing protein [SAR324 cluster bacterium]|nr:excalibur calcium-binding domain-containing protein [SAR324 cluster bacterium]MEC8595598.1 excalibur calcium-binding domain-containing protein [SAR324 cluster bacterium]